MALLPFSHPFTCIVSGPTGCGKTSFVLRLVDNVDSVIAPPPDKIFYYFTEYQSIFDRYPHVTFRQGVPKSDEIEDMHDALVILDDMMTEADQKILNIFTRGSHHREISVIFMVQNFFNKNKHMRTISLNAQYIVLFKNPREHTYFRVNNRSFTCRNESTHASIFAHTEKKSLAWATWRDAVI